MNHDRVEGAMKTTGGKIKEAAGKIPDAVGGIKDAIEKRTNRPITTASSLFRPCRVTRGRAFLSYIG